MIYYCQHQQIQPFDSRVHLVLFPVRFACSLWQTLSGTFRRITLPVLRLCYPIFSTSVLYAIYSILSRAKSFNLNIGTASFQHRYIPPRFQYSIISQTFPHAQIYIAALAKQFQTRLIIGKNQCLQCPDTIFFAF